MSGANRKRQMSFTFSRDVTNAIIAALAAPVHTVAGHSFNIACHERCTNAELFEMIAACLGVQVQLTGPRLPQRRQRRSRSSSGSRSASGGSASSSSSSSSSSASCSEGDISAGSGSGNSDSNSDTDSDEDDAAARDSKDARRRGVWESARLPLSRPCSYFPSVSFGCVEAGKAERLLPGFRATALQEAVRETVEFFRQAGPLYPSEWQDAIRNLPKGSPAREWIRHSRRKVVPPSPIDVDE